VTAGPNDNQGRPYHNGASQTQPVVIQFSGPIYSVIISKQGQFSCTDAPQVTAYYQGAQVAIGQLTPDPPSQCPSDAIGATLIFSYGGPIDKLVIAPFGVWTNSGGNYYWAYYQIGYYLSPPCVTNDAILDSPTIRQQFDSSFDAGYGNPPLPEGQRKEHIRVGYRYPDGTLKFDDMNITAANNCNIAAYQPQATNIDGAPLAYIMHTHPYDPGPLGGVADTMHVCGDSVYTPKVYPPRPSSRVDGPKNDWTYLDVVNSGRPQNGLPLVVGYVYDKRYVYRMEPNQGMSHPDSFATYDHSGDACRW
jgi:hypothetical protein